MPHAPCPMPHTQDKLLKLNLHLENYFLLLKTQLKAFCFKLNIR
ncbi:hypothetical protein FDUTEX481_01078 [Tolypothrix sp. PCC 7601]|nr:hypothetical protein FDUTEX481_01078 [Tolypothrix sp. PCC 7601]BAY91912.1 hypothetical protein NIES3275_39400 [Microchaete diplosiphon NIES-3275]